jgi:hypothetical protein
MVVLFLSFVASVTIYFEKKAPVYLKLFPPFLLLTFCIEAIGYYMRMRHIRITAMYNFFTAFEFIFYFSVLYRIINLRIIKKVVFACIWLYPVVALVNIFFIQGLRILHYYTLNLGALLIVIFTVTYFYQLIKYPVTANPLRESSFWICCGLLFFYSITLPITGALEVLPFKSAFELWLYYLLIYISNYFLYGLFAVGFLCRLRRGRRAQTPPQSLV